MESNTTPHPVRSVLVAAAAALLITSAVSAGVSLAAVGTASAAPTGIDECTTIDEAGTYALTADLTMGYERTSPCVRIAASDVTVDGDGHTVEAVSETNGPPVLIAGSGTVRNVTVRNVDISVPTVSPAPIDADGVSNSVISNVSATARGAFVGATDLRGNNNTVVGVTGTFDIHVTGDHNRVLDSTVYGLDSGGLNVTGDGNALWNVSVVGVTELTGANNTVRNSSFDGLYDVPAVTVGGTDAVFVDNRVTTTGLEIANSTGASIRGNTVTTENYVSVELIDSDDNSLVGNEFSSLTAGGFAAGSLSLVDSDDNTLRGNTIVGPMRFDDAESNLIYDNYVNTSERIGPIVPDGSRASSAWNVTPRSGDNVVGGDTVAGNYYANLQGTGFSQTCSDADADGLCDSTYELASGNVDHAPLTDPASGPAPVVGDSTPTDPDDDGLYEDVDGSDEVTYNDVVVFFGHFGDPAVQNHSDAYDFDGSGDVTYNDVVALAGEV